MEPSKIVHEVNLGKLSYQKAFELQEQLFDEIISQKKVNRKEDLPTPTKNYFLWVEHPPVITLGKSGKKDHLLLDETALADKGIAFFHTNRGGDITFHGPGQIVGYPLFDLDNFFTDIHRYLRYLEQAVIDTLEDYGLKGVRSPGETGVWLDVGTPFARKICALGVRASRWVTMHGFAFNVNTDLSYFDHIVPCGITGKGITSLEKELGQPLNLDVVRAKLKIHLVRLFEAQWKEIELIDLVNQKAIRL
ncbi:MAG: lipoyl(octanoyl) transferase LipB [Flavobacteriia bacterium]|nr:lipoyl(octanoyl) transferase LipB [Flavobacteriia bacterium]